jgi:hypothetical protein
MSDTAELLTIKEFEDFLVSMDKKKCPWCDGNHWGAHVHMNKGK